MKYWDEGNGRITDDPSYAPIVDGGGIYIETYEIAHKMRIDIAYTQETKEYENLYDYRKNVLERHNLKLSDLRRLVRLAVPSEKYKEIMKDNEE